MAQLLSMLTVPVWKWLYFVHSPFGCSIQT